MESTEYTKVPRIELGIRERRDIVEKDGVAVSIHGYLQEKEEFQKRLGRWEMSSENRGHVSSVEQLGGHVPSVRVPGIPDEELILAAYAKWGEDFIRQIAGSVTIAIWDENRNRFYYYRDRMGNMPCFYVYRDGLLLISSDIAGLLKDSRVKAEFRKETITEFLLVRYISGPETIYSDIRQLMPGECLISSEKGVTTKSYWDMQSAVTGRTMSLNADGHVEPVAEMIRQNMKIRTDRHPEIGVMYSGGLDSTFLLAQATELAEKVHGFTIGFGAEEDRDYQYAKQSRKYFKYEFHPVNVGNKEYADNLPRAIKNFNFPIDHPNFVARDILFRKAKEAGIPHLIAGEGADTIFGGAWYVSLDKHLTAKRLMPFNVARLMPFLKKIRFFRMLDNALRLREDELVILDKTYTDRGQICRILKKDDEVIRQAMAWVLGELNALGDMTSMDKAFYLALKTTLAVYPRDQIIMAESNGVELEYPLLDNNIVEYMYALPSSMKVKDFQAKYIFSKVCHKYLPEEMVKRKKCGLPVPLVSWFKDDKGLGRYVTMLKEERARARDLMDYDAVDQYIAEFYKGNDKVSELLWVLTNLELWQRIFIDKDPLYTS